MPATARHNPRVRVPDGRNPTSRPLKTGRTFYLVVKQQRLVQKVWDKAEYDPGEEAELKVVGQHLGGEPLELIIDRDEGTGERELWTEHARVQAEVNADQTEATVHWTPPQPDAAQQQGRLVGITVDPGDADPGATLSATLQTEDMEGAWIAWTVERLEPGGNWKTVALWDGGHIQDGAASTSWQTPDAEPAGTPDAGGALVSCAFEDDEADLEPGGSAWLSAQTEEVADGAVVGFVLERETADGGWEPVGDATATVRSGEARVGLTIPGERLSAPADGLYSAQLDGEPGATAPLLVRAEGAEGAWLEIQLEREVAPGRWEGAGAAVAQVQDGEARAELPLAAASGAAAAHGPIAHAEAPEDPQGEVGLRVEAPGADGQVLEATLEREVAPGRWEPAGSATAQVRDGEARASLLAAAAGAAAAHGPIAHIEAPAEPGGAFGLRVESAGGEGHGVEATLEREVAPGRWESAGSASAQVGGGEACAAVSPAASRAAAVPGPALPLVSIPHPLHPDAPALAHVRAEGREGELLQVTLERELGAGRWQAAAQVQASVSGGEASVALPPPAPAGAPASPFAAPGPAPRAAPAVASGRGWVELEVGPDLEGQDVDVELGPEAGVASQTVRARVQGGRARVRIPEALQGAGRTA